MGQRRIPVGTGTATLLANANPNRRSFSVLMPPSSVETANTGIVYVAKGFIPSAVAGNPNTGDALTQGTQFADAESYPDDPSVFKGQVWAIADTAAQILIVDETFKG